MLQYYQCQTEQLNVSIKGLMQILLDVYVKIKHTIQMNIIHKIVSIIDSLLSTCVCVMYISQSVCFVGFIHLKWRNITPDA